MSIDQRANIKFSFKLGKTFTETPQMMKKVYGDDCLFRSRIHAWFKRFLVGCYVVNEENTKIVREFIRKEPKSSQRYMESEVEIYWQRRFIVF